METPCEPFVDIHCHLLPGIDDGADSWETSLAMARMAVQDGIEVVVCTPHQLGAYAHNTGDAVRALTAELQQFLNARRVPLTVLPGGDVRIEDGMSAGLRNGRVLSLADRRRHVLLELPHELYFPLEPVLDDLARQGMQGILSHPERNEGLLRDRTLIPPLVERGCLMQITAGSLLGAFGDRPRAYCEWMLAEGLAHFVATDAHGLKSRRPRMRPAFERVMELTDAETALDLCCRSPGDVALGRATVGGVRKRAKKRGWQRWFRWAA